MLPLDCGHVPHPQNPKPRPPLADSALMLQCILDTVGDVRADSPASHGAVDMLLGLLREGSSMSSVAAAESSLKSMLGERLVHCCTESSMSACTVSLGGVWHAMLVA